MIYPQMLLDLHDELIVDLFAGGGGASCGIEMATGRQVDVAVNHDAAAVALHRLNHPQTTHHLCDVFEADPRTVTGGRPVGLLWASPDCTDHSKAKGGKPIRTRKRRALAWVVTRWAGQVRPRVIMLENVEEFAEWGPLIGPPGNLRRCPHRKAKTFRQWVRSLERLGYTVEWRELRACDYGAPTIRKRLFVIARCDGRPIVWPEPTHGPGRRYPYRTAAECIDWSIPMLSVFATREEAKAWARVHGVGVPRRPLADATLRRIARGVVRFVLENPEPFIVPNNTNNAPHSLRSPVPTVTGGGRNILAVPYLVPRYGERDGQEPRIRSIDEPAPVVVPTGNGGSLAAVHLSTYYGGERGEGRGADPAAPLATQATENRHAVVAAFLAQHNDGFYRGAGRAVSEPLSTIVQKGSTQALVAASLAKLRGTSHDADPAEPLHTVSAGGQHHGLIAAHIQRDFGASVGHGAGEPLATVTGGGGGKAGLVAAFLQSYYGQGIGQSPADPARTIPTVDRFGLVTIEIAGEPYVIADIAMRMLQPRELYRAQGFPDSYVIDRGADGRRLTKTEQVRMCGNSVPPQFAAALVRVNVPELRARDRVVA